MKKVILRNNLPKSIFYDVDGQKYVNLSKVFAIKDSYDFYIKADKSYISISDGSTLDFTNCETMPLLDYYTQSITTDVDAYSAPIIGMPEKYLSQKLLNALVNILMTAIRCGKQVEVYGAKIHKCPNISDICVDYQYLKELQQNNILWLQQERERKQKDSKRNCEKYKAMKLNKENQK